MSDVDNDVTSAGGDQKNGSKLDKVINKISMECNSREGSPDPSKKKSRRKPTVTRKVEAENEAQLESLDPENSFDMDEAVPTNEDEMEVVEEQEVKSPPLINGNSQKMDKDEIEDKPKENAEDFVIPEGTVIVEPEPVEDPEHKEYKGPEWKATKRLSRSVALGIVQCTACNKQINTNQSGSARRHPVLKVLICKRCYTWYASSEIEQDSDGMDEQCRWCGDGGNLICCDFCHNAFCKGCIKKNLGRKELSDIIDAGDDDKWHCYVCDPKPLANLISDCTATIEAIENEHNKKKEPPRKPPVMATKPKTSGSHKDFTTPKPSKTTQVAKKSTTQGVKSINRPTIVTGSQGPIVLPPGAIPVKTVLNSSGNQVIVLQQPVKTVQVQKPKVSKPSFLSASEEQLRIIGQAVKNVSQAKAQSIVSITPKKPVTPAQKVTNRSPMVRYEWEAPINEYNVAQTLDRTLAVTESLRMVMVSLKEDMKKANQLPVTQCLEKKRVVSAKLKRAMGAFKKQVQDIELFCKSTYKTVKLSPSQQQGKPTNKSQPFPISIVKSKSTSNVPPKPSPKSKKAVEVIELSSSDEEPEKPGSKKTDESTECGDDSNTSKEKKSFTLKLKLDGDASSLGANRKRKHSGDDKDISDNEKEQESESLKNEEPKDKKSKSEDKEVSGNESEEILRKDELVAKEENQVAKSTSGVQETDDLPDVNESANENKDDIPSDMGKDLKETENDETEKLPEVKHVLEQESESDTEVKDNSESKIDNIVEKETESNTEVKDNSESKMDDIVEKETESKVLKQNEHYESDSEKEGANEKCPQKLHETSQCKEKHEGVSEEKSIHLDTKLESGKEPSEKMKEVESKVEETSNQPEKSETKDGEDDHALPEKAETEDGEDDHELLTSENKTDAEKTNFNEPNNDSNDRCVTSPENETATDQKMDVEQVDGCKDKKQKAPDESEKSEAEDDNDMDTSFGGLKFEPLFNEATALNATQSTKGGKNHSRKEINRESTRSRSDIEAQRALHKELLEDDSTDDEGPGENVEDSDCQGTDSSNEDPSKSEKDSDEEYNPDSKNKSRQSRHHKDKDKKGTKKIEKRKTMRKTKQKKKSKRTNSSGEESEKAMDEILKKSSRKKKTSKSNTNCTDMEIDKKEMNQKSKSSFKKRTNKDFDSDIESSVKSSQLKLKRRKSHNSLSDKSSVKNSKPSKDREKDQNSDESQDSDEKSSNYDSELERDIERLAQAPKITKPKGQKSKKEIETNDKKTNSKSEIKSQGKTKSQKDLLADLSNSSGGEHESDVDEVLEEENEKAQNGFDSDGVNLEEAGNKAMAALEAGLGYDDLEEQDFGIEEQEKDSKDGQARKELLAGGSSASESDDSDVEAILAQKLEKENDSKQSSKPSSAKSSAVQSEDEDNDKESTCDSEVSGAKKSNRKANKLLDAKLSDNSDSDFEFSSKKKSVKDKDSSCDEEEGNDGSNSGNNLSDISSDFDIKPKKKIIKKKKKSSSSEQLSASESDTDKNGKKGKKGKKRIRIKVASDSSHSGNESGEDDKKGAKKKKIRKLIKDNKLSQDTKSAAKAEEERRQRIEERQKLYNQVDEEDVNSPTKAKITTKLVLEMDEDKEPVIEVHSKLIRKLKPHQVDAVRFLWDCCIETVDRAKEDGAGCILAHCMGLGKTLSMITFVHTLMSYPDLTNIERALVVCPLNTVLNWQNEFSKWLDEKDRLDVYELSTVKDNGKRVTMLEEWYKDGGIMIIGYEMYRNLSTCKNIRKAKQKKTFTKSLVDPGPDIVICDEGHILKNDASALSKAMNTIRTRRRICLTGTPLQNNLAEYHCMVDFVKPKLLGTRKEFMNRFVNPIKNGQCSDSTSYDVKLMKKRAHILHETLAGCVQRKDYSALTKFLPPKHEYVISIRLSEVQIELYEKYLSRVGHGPLEGEKLRSAQLFTDYQALMRIWTHPWVLKLQHIREENKRMMQDSDDSLIDDDSFDSFIDDSDASETFESEQSEQSLSDDSDGNHNRNRRSGRNKKSNQDKNGKQKKNEVVKKWKTASRGGEEGSRPVTPQEEQEKETKLPSEWWSQHLCEEDQYNVEIGGKILLLAEVLRMSEAIGDKVLVFSQSLLSLDLIEDFLCSWDTPYDQDSEKPPIGGTMGWTKGVDYFRMDGSTSAQYRMSHAGTFNDPDNIRARLFLISTRAGSLGTNLVGANRVIIFDASWNPSHDTQSIFRVYRFGQTKPVYIYRFLAQGTMEEKIYERQVTKQSLSQRVVDEHQIERHFSTADLAELYNFTPSKLDDASDDEYLHILPKDLMLADLLTEQKRWIVKYHEHDSLLENKMEENLTEEERKAAWEEYELEKKQGYRTRAPVMAQNTTQFYQHYNMGQSLLGASNVGFPNQQGVTPPPPQYTVQQIEQLARAIYAANPGMEQTELQKRVQIYIQHQQIQFYQRQREQMRQQSYAYMQQLQTDKEQTGGAGSGTNTNYGSLLRNMANQNSGNSSHQSSRSNSPLPMLQSLLQLKPS